MNLNPNDLLDSVRLDFILGSARSGTTLLTRILDEHPNCTAKTEKKHTLLFYKRFCATQYIEEKHIKAYANYLKHNFPSTRAYSESQLKAFLYTSLPIGTPISYSQLSKKIFLLAKRSEREEKDITHIVDKNPFYTFHTDTLLKINSQSKFILMVRDYRAVVLSNLQSHHQKYGLLKSFFYAYSWKKYNQALQTLQEKYPDKCLLVHYEDLSGVNAEKVIEQVCSFMQLSYKKELLHFHSYNPNVPKHTENKERRLKIKGDLSQPINANRAYSWKTQLSKREIEKIEFVAGKIGEDYGYEPITHISRLRSGYYYMLSLPARFSLWCYYRLNSVRLDYRINVSS